MPNPLQPEDTIPTYAPLPSGEAVIYATAEDIEAARDLIEINVKVLRWKKNGQPIVLRVRALDLIQQERILAEAREKDGTINWTRYCLATLREGIIVPTSTDAQVRQFAKKNPRVIEQLVYYIWSLSDIDQDALDATAASLADVPLPAAPDA